MRSHPKYRFFLLNNSLLLVYVEQTIIKQGKNRFLDEIKAISIYITMTNSYEKNTVCTKEIVVYIYSIDIVISPKTINFEI